MKIKIQNIGAIDLAEIDLDKDLIVFCGPNNTGKTYVAYTLYGLYKYSFASFDKDDLVHSIIKSNASVDEIKFDLDLILIKRLIKEKCESVVNNLPSIFASDKSFFANAKVDIQIDDEEIIDTINELSIDYKYRIGNSYYNLKKSINSNIITLLNTKELVDKNNSTTPDDFIYDVASRVINFYIFSSIFSNPYITPTERTAINIFSKELSANRTEIVDKLLDFKGKNLKNSPLKDAQRYSMPIRDCLEIAEDLSNKQKNISDYAFLADAIEDEILKGKINVSSSGQLQFRYNNDDANTLNINLSSSIVKSLSNLVFYFRHIAETNDFIIIDEPELNLHPDNQIIIARLIGRIVNYGFKVLISTHSDYIVKELNNLIRLKSEEENAKNLIEKYQYNKKDLLNKDAIGVYLFKNRQTHNLEVSDLGFEIQTIENENCKLAEISESIYFELFDKSE